MFSYSFQRSLQFKEWLIVYEVITSISSSNYLIFLQQNCKIIWIYIFSFRFTEICMNCFFFNIISVHLFVLEFFFNSMNVHQIFLKYASNTFNMLFKNIIKFIIGSLGKYFLKNKVKLILHNLILCEKIF